MSDYNGPGFFGNGFDINGDGQLDSFERANDLAQFMDSYGDDMINGTDDMEDSFRDDLADEGDSAEEAEGDDEEGFIGSYVPGYIPPSPHVTLGPQETSGPQSNYGPHVPPAPPEYPAPRRRNYALVLSVLAIIIVALLLRYTNIVEFNHGMFQRQQSNYHGIMTTYEDAGLILQIPEDWERRENPKSAKWDQDTFYLCEYQNFSDDGKYFALATVRVRRQHKLRQQGEVLPELELYQKYGLYHEYKAVEVPGYPLAYRQDFSFAPVVEDDPGTIGTTQVVFTENQAVEITVMGNKGYLAHSDIKAILDAVDYSEFEELD